VDRRCVFTIHHGWLRDYAAEMHRRQLHIPLEMHFYGQTVEHESVDLLAELGCFRVWSVRRVVRRNFGSMQRGVTVQQVQSAIAMCKERGIQTGMFLCGGTRRRLAASKPPSSM